MEGVRLWGRGTVKGGAVRGGVMGGGVIRGVGGRWGAYRGEGGCRWCVWEAGVGEQGGLWGCEWGVEAVGGGDGERGVMGGGCWGLQGGRDGGRATPIPLPL